MSKPWPNISLGELLHLERRPVKVKPEKFYQEIGIYCFGRGIFHKTPRTGLEVGDKDLFLMKEGDFILQVTFAWEGAVAIVEAAEEGMYGSTRYPTFRVDESCCVPRFLLSYFKTEQGIQQLVRICPGSAGRNRVLSIRRIPEVLVPLPSLAEQQRVVEWIEKLSTQIQESRTLRHQAVVEGEALLPAGRSAAFNRVFDRNYDKQTLDEVAPINMGQSPPGYSYNDTKDGPPLLNGPTEFGPQHPTPIQWTIAPTKMCRAGDILLCVRGATTGRMNWADREYCIGRGLAALTANPKICLPEYVHHFVATRTQEMLALAAGSTFPNLPGTKLKKLEIPVPPLPEQRQIVSELDALKAEVDVLRRLQAETAAELDALLPAILDKAFKGEL